MTNRTEYAPPTPEKKRFHPRRWLAIMVMASAALAACGGNDGLITANPNQPPTASSEAPNPALDTWESYSATMEKYKGYDISTFESLPRDERLLYSQYLLDKVVVDGSYKDLYKESGRHHDNMITPVAVSSDNNGQEILDNGLYNYQLAYIQTGDNPEDDLFDISDGQKALSSYYYEVGDSMHISGGYQPTVETMQSLTYTVATEGKWTATNTSDLLTGVDINNGEQVNYKIVTYVDSATSKTVYTRFVFHEFTNYDGKRKAIWLTDVNGYTLEELADAGSIQVSSLDVTG